MFKNVFLNKKQSNSPNLVTLLPIRSRPNPELMVGWREFRASAPVRRAVEKWRLFMHGYEQGVT
jgi:hypothetical protein